MRAHLIFDGDCGFCTTSANWLAARLNHDESDPFVAPWQRLDLSALGVDPQRTAREVVWLAEDGTQAGGAQAFAAWLQHRPGLRRSVGTALTWPGIRHLAAAGYQLLAQYRHKLPGGTPACALPPNQT